MKLLIKSTPLFLGDLMQEAYIWFSRRLYAQAHVYLGNKSNVEFLKIISYLKVTGNILEAFKVLDILERNYIRCRLLGLQNKTD